MLDCMQLEVANAMHIYHDDCDGCSKYSILSY